MWKSVDVWLALTLSSRCGQGCEEYLKIESTLCGFNLGYMSIVCLKSDELFRSTKTCTGERMSFLTNLMRFPHLCCFQAGGGAGLPPL